MLNENEHTYLAKWVNNELSSQDLEDLKNLPEYEDYNKIITGMQFFKAPSFDLERSLTTTIEKVEQRKKSKVIRLRPFIYGITAAASIVLIIGLFFNTITYTADPGQQLAVHLPDGSSVELNAGSTLSHQRFFWSSDRQVLLEGEAFFKVTKGNTFTVQSNLGAVEVLGTQFNVKERSKFFEVVCYEGKVRVSAKDQQTILEQGDKVILQDNKLTPSKASQQQPLWLQGQSLFSSMPLSEVLDEIERQFEVTFIREDIDQNKLFTGGFMHNDLAIALESVLTPMRIRYQVVNKTITLSR